jgi:hypothetical protein
MTWATVHGAMCGIACISPVQCNLIIFIRDKLANYDLRKAGFIFKDREWQHEHASEMMFDDMMKQYALDIPPKDVMFIKALIAGDRNRCRSVIRFPHVIHLSLIFRKR